MGPTRFEALGVIFRLLLHPGVNLTHLARQHTLVGLKDTQPVLLHFGLTSLLMGMTRAETLNPTHLGQLPKHDPSVTMIPGLDRGLFCSVI